MRPQSKPRTLDSRQTVESLAAEIVAKSNRSKPADAILRETLARQRFDSPGYTAEVSRAVYSYYRWGGWLQNERGVEAKLRRALEFAERFRQNPFSLPADSLRAKAVPEWVQDEVQVSDAWLRALQREPQLWLRARKGQGRSLAKKLGSAKSLASAGLPDTVLYEGQKDLFRSLEFHAGEFEIQDVSSQIVGLICDPRPSETWWDACAGEGGKALHLSDLMENRGLIWASDRAGWRLKILKRRAKRAKAFNYRTAMWNGDAKLPTKAKFDGVLVDAPCSGLGTWQRNPHARWTTTLADVKELSGVQSRLLAHVAPAVKPGGKLVYAVCTLTRSETTAVVECFNREQPMFEPFSLPPITKSEQNQETRVSSSTKWMWPQEMGGNGMFVAAWRRRAD